MLRILTINALVLMGALAALELVFGTWFSDVHALHQFTKPRNLNIERKNLLSEAPPITVYSRDKNGFRGIDGETAGIDIITVGGSTTDQRFLDDKQTFQATLQNLFAEEDRHVLIANAGIDGQTTFGHVENFPSWFELIDGLETRYFLFYVGINDVLIDVKKHNYDSVSAQSAMLKFQLFIREKSAFYQTYLIARQAYYNSNVSHTFETQNLAIGEGLVDQPKLTPEAFETPDTQSALAALTDRIEKLASLSRSIGAEAIFVTQRSATWIRKEDEIFGVSNIKPGFHNALRDRFGSINGVDMYNIERGVADAILTGCRATNAVCFDLLADVDFDLETDFYDSVHTTDRGSTRIAVYLHKMLNATAGF